MVSVALTARQKHADQERQQPSEQEQAMTQRLYEAQIGGKDSDFYEALDAFMDYLEGRKDWDKYYRMWLNRVIYEVNNKHFHRAFAEIQYIIDDIQERHQEHYLYIANMGLGFFYNGRNQPEAAEKYFRLALQGIDVEKNPVAAFNAYLSLGQSLSFKRPAEAMACLDSLPKQMLEKIVACWATVVSLPTNWATARPSTVISPDMTASATICQSSSMPLISSK